MNIEHAQNALKLNTYSKQTDILVHIGYYKKYNDNTDCVVSS